MPTSPQLSAEFRWFWKDDPPAGLYDWFCEGQGSICAAGGGGEIRQDVYLRDPRQPQLGIKRRGGKPGVEIKSLFAIWELPIGSIFAAPIQLWVKQTSTALELPEGATIRTSKTRRLRTFDLTGGAPQEIPLGPAESPLNPSQAPPARGCNVELTKVVVEGQTWWTLGFESFQASDGLNTIEHDTWRTAEEMASRNPPPLGTPLLASYPEWLCLFVQGD
ncbi:MAG TPA: hypothetical protein VGN57_12100 [Pirellulaceae bacterium]|jgi:hypothetical protein|nr:hypothetical protein [Pirellulaceae bacterium]